MPIVIISEDAHNHGPEREHGTKVKFRLVANPCLVKAKFYRATSVSAVVEIDIKIG